MLAALATAAERRGWTVDLVFPEEAGDRRWLHELLDAGFRCRLLGLRRKRLSRWATDLGYELTDGLWLGSVGRAVGEMLDESPVPTLMHTHFSMMDVPAAQAARRNGHAHVIWHEHLSRARGSVDLGGLIIYRVFGRTVERFICVASNIADALRPHVRDTRVVVIPNGIGLEELRPASQAERFAARQEFGLAHDEIVLLHFGYHWLRKGGDILLATLCHVLGRHGGVRVRAVIVGGNEARAAVSASQVAEAVSVISPREDVRSLYAAADVLLSLSRAEGMPFAVLEALAVGTPVIASPIPGHAEIAAHVEACRLVPLDVPSIVAELDELLRWDRATLARHVVAARRWIAQERSLDSVAGHIMDVYERILEEDASKDALPEGRT
jgi:glycosyltransferase involved in cell wall biosynthesis